MLHNSIISKQHPRPGLARPAGLVAVEEGGEAEDDRLVVEAEDVEGGLGLGEGGPAGVGDAVEVSGEEEEPEVSVVESDGHTSLSSGRLGELTDHREGESGPVHGDDLVPDAVHGPLPRADAARVCSIDEDVLVGSGWDLFMDKPGLSLLVVDLSERIRCFQLESESTNLCGQDRLQSYGVHPTEDEEFLLLADWFWQVGQVSEGARIVEVTDVCPLTTREEINLATVYLPLV